MAATIYVAYLQAAGGESAAEGQGTESTTAKGESGGAAETKSGESGATSGESTTATAEKEPANPILPIGTELAWGLGTFLLLWALMKFVLLKPVVQGMKDRDAKVRADLAAAEQAGEQAKTSLAEYHHALSGSKAEATRIIEDGRAQGEATRKELIGAAEADAAAQKAEAAEEVARAKEAAKDQIRGSVASIAVEAAGVVIQKPLDVDAQRPVVDEYLSRSPS